MADVQATGYLPDGIKRALKARLAFEAQTFSGWLKARAVEYLQQEEGNQKGQAIEPAGAEN